MNYQTVQEMTAYFLAKIEKFKSAFSAKIPCWFENLRETADQK